MSVVKPWRVVDPGPLRSHWLAGVPENLFSVTIAFCANAPFSVIARQKTAASKILTVSSLRLARHSRRRWADQLLRLGRRWELIEVNALSLLNRRFDDSGLFRRSKTTLHL